MMTEEQRRAVVEEAKSWLRTPYHHLANVKGHGVDCAMLLVEVYSNCGVVPHVDPRPYPVDWHLHRDDERFLEQLFQHRAVEIHTRPQPGDIMVFKYGRTYSHGAIVIDYPLVIHAHQSDRAVVWGDATQPPLGDRHPRAFTIAGDL